MNFIRKYWEYITLIYRYVRFKVRQNRLKTNETFVVVTTYGPIKGIKRYTIWNIPFYSFEKIPFAKPPIGELRFKAPVSPDPWEEVKDCTAEGPIPLQTNLISKRIEGSEDCLYLNVYTKNLNPEKLMPVMIWIYGGGFETGGATKDLYSPDYFMEKDVVLITINYRVGPFGFLVFNDPDLNIPGNAGLKDQVLALKWIKANCMNFGGDPDNITVFGESAGAASTHYMMLTDQTKGLFHKTILMSGSVLCPWALVPNIQSGYRLAKALHYNGSNINDNVCFEYIKNAKGKDILHAEHYVLNNSDKNKRILFPFGPVIEPYITNDCIIPEHPRIMIHKSWSINIPMIIGGTANEGLIMFSETKKSPHLITNLGNCENLVPLDLNLNDDSSTCQEFGLKLKNAYFNDEEPSSKNMFCYFDLMSYKLFWHPIHRVVLSRLNFSDSDTLTYLYRFDIDSEYFNVIRITLCDRNLRGVCHADDLCYLFLSILTPNILKNSKEYNAIQRFLSSLTNFAETDDPNKTLFKYNENNYENSNLTINNMNTNTIESSKILKLSSSSSSSSDNKSIWQPLNKKQKPFMCLNFDLEKNEMIPLPEYEKLQLWDSFYPEDLLY